MMRFGMLLALPAAANAVLRECANDLGTFTGVSGCIKGPLNSDCATTLRLECDTMYDFTQYTDSGIPCSTGTPGCSPGDEIAFPNPVYPIEALDALNDVVAARLVRGANNNDGITAGIGDLLDTEQLELYLSSDAHLNVTFLSEGACDRNSFGFVMFHEDEVKNGDPREMTFIQRRDILRDVVTYTIMFPNVDLEFCVCDAPDTPSSYDDFCTETSPELTRGTTMRMLPNFRYSRTDLLFPIANFVVPFILDDGFDKGYRMGETWAQNIETVLFSTPELNDPDMVRKTGTSDDFRQHAFVFRGPGSVTVPSTGELFDFSEEIFFCFEDRRRFDGGRQTDNDFEDLCFFITADPPLKGFEPSAAPTEDPEVPSSSPTVAGSAEPTVAICDLGILSDCGNVCCAASCGACGGCDCDMLPGGAEACCPRAILFTGMDCITSVDVGCVVDETLVCVAPNSGCA